MASKGLVIRKDISFQELFKVTDIFRHNILFLIKYCVADKKVG